MASLSTHETQETQSAPHENGGLDYALSNGGIIFPHPYRTPPRQGGVNFPTGPTEDSDDETGNENFVTRRKLHDTQQGSLEQSHSLAQTPPQTLTIDAASAVEDNSAPSTKAVAAPRARTISGMPATTKASLKATGARMGQFAGGTPVKPKTTMDFPDDRDLEAQSLTLVEEMGEVLDAGNDYIETRFKRFERGKIEQYVNNGAGGFYNKRTQRWNLPNKAKKEKNIYGRMVNLMNDVLETFLSPTAGVSREVVDTHDRQFRHKKNNYTSPDMVVCAEGPSFGKPERADIGYSNVATYFDVKREKDMGGRDKHVKQMSLYARQVLAHQPNRLFVRCLLLSEQTCRLFHFDRSGVQVSPSFDIHKHPSRFVTVILGLSDTDERSIGLDTSIQWRIDSNGRKAGGTLKFKTGRNTMKEYNLIDNDPIARHVIRGRATNCWAVKDNEGREFIVKDSWTAFGRTREYEFLKKAQGCEGVCKVVSQHVSLGQTKAFRCRSAGESEHFHNRVGSRIMLEAYGRHLEFFESILQLISALFDAIAGHMQLVAGASIVHRDINDKNVLLGRDDAKVGWRGVLIDLGVAVDFDKASSCAVLDNLSDLTKEKPAAHDYLDDLEGFFYLLCRLLLQFRKDGTSRPANDPTWKVIEDWDSENIKEALNSKSNLFNPGRRQKRIALEAIKREWGTECVVLFKKFLEWVGAIQVEKEDIRAEAGPQDPDKESIYKGLLKKCDDHYAQVLEIFEEAIIALGGNCEKPPPDESNAGSSTTKRPRSSDMEVESEGSGPPLVRARRESTRTLRSQAANVLATLS